MRIQIGLDSILFAIVAIVCCNNIHVHHHFHIESDELHKAVELDMESMGLFMEAFQDELEEIL